MNCISEKLCLLLLCMCLGGCIRDIAVDLPPEPTRLVLQAAFEPQQPFRVLLSTSLPVGSAGQPLPITEAEVYVEQEGVRVMTLQPTYHQGQWLWESALNAQAAVPYTLHARVPGFPSVFAVSHAPAAVVPPRVFLKKDQVDTLPNGRFRLSCQLHVDRPVPLPTPPFFGFSIEVLYSDTAIASSIRPASFIAGDTLSASLYTVSASTYMLHQNYWQKDKRDLVLTIPIEYNPHTEVPRQLIVQWLTLSEDFYKYYRSLGRQGANIPLYDPDALYNNVEGGYGNFSGFARSTHVLPIPL